MGLPATITLNIGTPPADVVFGDSKMLANTTSFTAVSPQADLLGRRSLRFSSEDKARGTVGTLIRLEFPHYKSADGAYHPVVPSIHCVVTVAKDMPTLVTATLLEAMRELLANASVANAIETGTL